MRKLSIRHLKGHVSDADKSWGVSWIPVFVEGYKVTQWDFNNQVQCILTGDSID